MSNKNLNHILISVLVIYLGANAAVGILYMYFFKDYGMNTVITAQLISNILVILGTVLVLTTTKADEGSSTSLVRTRSVEDAATGALTAMGVLGSYMISMLVVMFTTTLFPDVQMPIQSQLGSRQHAGLVVFISACLIAPVTEELIFRGVVYGYLRYHFGVWAGIIVSSLVFAAAHGLTMAFPVALFSGMLFCYIYEKDGSIYTVMTTHCIYNSLGFLLNSL